MIFMSAAADLLARAIEVSGLCVTYGDLRAVDDVSFTVPNGELLVLIGLLVGVAAGLTLPEIGFGYAAGALAAGNDKDLLALQIVRHTEGLA